MSKRILAACGNPDFGRLGNLPLANQDLFTVVHSLLDVSLKTIATGAASTYAVSEDGSVYSFGYNQQHQLGHSTGEIAVSLPQEVPLPVPAASISAGYHHTLCLDQLGNVWSWGTGGFGQLGLGQDITTVPEPRLIKSLQGADVVAISAGAEHSLALTRAGELFSFGRGAKGRLGHGMGGRIADIHDEHDEFLPRQVRSLLSTPIQHINAGFNHSAVIAEDGALYVFGSNEYKNLGIDPGKMQMSSVPQRVPGLSHASAVSCGGLHTLALKYYGLGGDSGGLVVAWGANQNGVLGLGEAKDQNPLDPTPVTGDLVVQSVSAGWKHSGAITAGGEVLTWGWGGSVGTAMVAMERGGGGGQLGVGDQNDRWAPSVVERLADSEGGEIERRRGSGGVKWRGVEVCCGLNHTALLVEMLD
jgi:alpha-tubulin suppressor-like RCC1 family protein